MKCDFLDDPMYVSPLIDVYVITDSVYRFYLVIFME